MDRYKLKTNNGGNRVKKIMVNIVIRWLSPDFKLDLFRPTRGVTLKFAKQENASKYEHVGDATIIVINYIFFTSFSHKLLKDFLHEHCRDMDKCLLERYLHCPK